MIIFIAPVSQYCNIATGKQGATRLDGARGKKQVWRPHVRNRGLSEENVLYWTKHLLGHLLGRFGAPRNDLAPP